MRKYFIVALLSVIAVLPMQAQRRGGLFGGGYSHGYGYRENYFGLRVGPVFTGVHSDDSALDLNAQTGLNIGCALGFNIANSTPLYLETGLYYVEKGGKKGSGESKRTCDLNYLQVPLVVKYIYELDRDMSIQPFLGFYGAAGVGGKVRLYSDRSATSSFDDDYFRRLDAGVRIGCGFGYNMFYADLTYDLGLANISHDSFDSATNGAFYVTMGVNF